MAHYKNYIAGEWVDSSDGKTSENTNPATGELIGHFASASADDTQRAIAAAQEALPKWGNLPGPNRGAILAASAAAIFRALTLAEVYQALVDEAAWSPMRMRPRGLQDL